MDKPETQFEKPIAYEAYEKLAESYASLVDTKPHNAYYERPAMLDMLPDLAGLDVLDAGCGPGVYAEHLLQRGAKVVSVDASNRMLELARERVGDRVEFHQLNLTQPLTMFSDQQFDLVNAPLCLDYIEDWNALFADFYRVLKPGGFVLYSGGHPAFDAEYFNSQQYFSVEHVTCTWKGFGIDVEMPGYRRSLEENLMPAVRAGFILDKIHEPLPTEDFKKSDLRRYLKLMHRPCFLCVRVRKPS